MTNTLIPIDLMTDYTKQRGTKNAPLLITWANTTEPCGQQPSSSIPFVVVIKAVK